MHFQRRALRLPENTSYSDLTAFLTAAGSPSEVDGFPYLRGLDGNGTGNNFIFLLPGKSVFASFINVCIFLSGRTRGAKGGNLSTSSGALKPSFNEFSLHHYGVEL